MWVKQVIFFLCCNFSFALDTVGATFLTCSANFTLLQFEMRNAEDTSLKIKCHNQLLEATQKAVTGLLNYMYEGFLIAELSPFACRECAALWAFKAKHLAAWRGTEWAQQTTLWRRSIKCCFCMHLLLMKIRGAFIMWKLKKFKISMANVGGYYTSAFTVRINTVTGNIFFALRCTTPSEFVTIVFHTFRDVGTCVLLAKATWGCKSLRVIQKSVWVSLQNENGFS